MRSFIIIMLVKMRYITAKYVVIGVQNGFEAPFRGQKFEKSSKKIRRILEQTRTKKKRLMLPLTASPSTYLVDKCPGVYDPPFA